MATSNQPPLSAVIPNWNGAVLLRRHLPGLLAELAQFHSTSECIVVDDGSTDDSLRVLREEFPQVRVIYRPQNSGFGSSVNAGIEAALHERLLILNNDVSVTPGFLVPLQIAFDSSPDTFAVSALQREQDPAGLERVDGLNTVQWRHGHLEFCNRTAEAVNGAHPQLAYCTAGCSLFSKEKLLALGGFCELFDPFYYEDSEVGLQALRRGWRLAFVPESVVDHRHGSSARRKPWKLKFIPVRNFFLIHWLLLDTPPLWRRHLTHVAARALSWPLRGRVRYTIGLALALSRLPQLLRERRRRENGKVRSTADVLHSFDYDPTD